MPFIKPLILNSPFAGRKSSVPSKNASQRPGNSQDSARVPFRPQTSGRVKLESAELINIGVGTSPRKLGNRVDSIQFDKEDFQEGWEPTAVNTRKIVVLDTKKYKQENKTRSWLRRKMVEDKRISSPRISSKQLCPGMHSTEDMLRKRAVEIGNNKVARMQTISRVGQILKWKGAYSQKLKVGTVDPVEYMEFL